MSVLNYALPENFQLQHYTLLSVLGDGGFGITYKAVDNRLKRLVAIKEFLPTQYARRTSGSTSVEPYEHSESEYEVGLSRFLAEAQVLATFDHPNIVKVHTFFEANDTAYLVMAYEEGKSLKSYLYELNRPLSERECLDLFLPILDGLSVVHQEKFVHRDIKPDNIYLKGQQGTDSFKPILIDFGASREVIEDEDGQVTIMLSPDYAAPEQYAHESKSQGQWTDLYAIGSTLYFCIFGQTPPRANRRQRALSESQSDPYRTAIERGKDHYSPSFLMCIDKMLAMKIQERCQSIEEVIDGLTAANEATVLNPSTMDSEPQPAAGKPAKSEEKLKEKGTSNIAESVQSEQGPLKVEGKVSSRSKLPIKGFAALMVVVVIGVVLTIWLSSHQSERPVESDLLANLGIQMTPVGLIEVSQHEITRAQFAQFVKETNYVTSSEKQQESGFGCQMYQAGRWRSQPGISWMNPGYPQADTHPVVCVSWEDAQAFVNWLSKSTGKKFRLISKFDWQSFSRIQATNAAESPCLFMNGADQTPGNILWSQAANCSDGFFYTAPVGSKTALIGGLYDLLGNVAEWTEECGVTCTTRIIRGGSWMSPPQALGFDSGESMDGKLSRNTLGFRVVSG